MVKIMNKMHRLFFMGMILVVATSFSMSPKLPLSAADKRFINQFSSETQSAINDVIEIRTAFIVQKSYFALIGDKTSLSAADLLESNNSFNRIKEELSMREIRLKKLLQSQDKASEEGYYNYVFNRIKNFVNRLLGYQNTQVEQYISRKIVEELQEVVKEFVEKRQVLLFNKEQNKTVDLNDDLHTLDVLIKAISDDIYMLQPVSGRMISTIKNTFWKS